MGRHQPDQLPSLAPGEQTEPTQRSAIPLLRPVVTDSTYRSRGHAEDLTRALCSGDQRRLDLGLRSHLGDIGITGCRFTGPRTACNRLADRRDWNCWGARSRGTWADWCDHRGYMGHIGLALTYQGNPVGWCHTHAAQSKQRQEQSQSSHLLILLLVLGKTI